MADGPIERAPTNIHSQKSDEAAKRALDQIAAILAEIATTTLPKIDSKHPGNATGKDT